MRVGPAYYIIEQSPKSRVVVSIEHTTRAWLDGIGTHIARRHHYCVVRLCTRRIYYFLLGRGRSCLGKTCRGRIVCMMCVRCGHNFGRRVATFIIIYSSSSSTTHRRSSVAARNLLTSELIVCVCVRSL